MYEDLEAGAGRTGREAAVATLTALVLSSREKQVSMIDRVLNVSIVDKLVSPKMMTFFSDQEGPHFYLTYNGVGAIERRITIHPHALGQLAALCKIGSTYLNKVLLGQPYSGKTAYLYQLAAHNLNELFHKGDYLDRRKQPTKFLHRLVGTELRGVLSRNYNRKLSTANLLKPFLETCSAHRAAPVSVRANDIRVVIKCMVPTVFEPVDGEFVAIGATFTNSDFGSGRMRVSGTCIRLKTGSAVVMEDVMCKVHLGSIIEESDLELSAETEDAELNAYQLAVRDTTQTVLAPESVQKTLNMIRAAHEKEIPWYKLSAQLGKVLQKNDLTVVEKLLTGTSDEVIDLPPVSNQKATAWWAANVLGWLAEKQPDEDKRASMQILAGELVAGAVAT